MYHHCYYLCVCVCVCVCVFVCACYFPSTQKLFQTRQNNKIQCQSFYFWKYFYIKDRPKRVKPRKLKNNFKLSKKKQTLQNREAYFSSLHTNLGRLPDFVERQL